VEKAVKQLVSHGSSWDPPLPSQWPVKTNRFLTFPKSLIVKDVEMSVRQLTKNVFVDKSGNSSRLIYGEKGIGKSSALTLATMGVWLEYRNVIPIHVEYLGPAEQFKSPSELLTESLKLPPSSTLSTCLAELERVNKYSLLIADEIEQVYQGTNEEHVRRKILDELAELGSQRSGRVYTYICGSSSMTPALICKYALHHTFLRKEFPMLDNCPNLNGQKFASFRIHHGDHHVVKDFETIGQMYGIGSRMLNFLYFLCGSNLRTIDNVNEKIVEAAPSGEISDQLVKSVREYCFPPSMWDQRAERRLTTISQ
jgi:hypothetical protein